MRLFNRLLPVIFLLGNGYGFAQKPLQEFELHGFAQGTSYSISYFAAGECVDKAGIDSILGVIDNSMSLYEPGSLISRFNESAAGMTVDSHFLKVYKKAKQVYKATGGRFDATVAPLVQLWGFGPHKIDSLPGAEAIKAALACVGMDMLKSGGSFIRKTKSCVKLDFNGIAQGYSVDVIARYLRKRGISRFMVELGGELRVQGAKPDGKPFRIGIEGPVNRELSVQGIKHVIGFKRGAVTTSGNYRKYLTSGGNRLSHLIDPKSGYPLAGEMISVTVFAKDAITADGYDNALMAMNVDEALRFVRKHGLEVYLIYRDANGEPADIWSRGFQKLIVN